MEQTFNWEGPHYLACNEKRTFFTCEQPKYMVYGHAWRFVTLSIIF